MRRAAGYIRVSREKEDGLSPETQLEKIKQYCDLHELELVRVYPDLDFTGRNDKRPHFREMINDVSAGKYDVVLVYKLDRFARSVGDFHRYMGMLDKAGCDLVSISQNLDTSTPVGRLMRNVIVDFAQFESEMISERVKDNMIQNARRGRRNGGAAPFGYRWNGNTMEPDPVNGPLLQELFRRYATGTGAPSLAAWLNDMGIKPSYGGKKWRHDAILYILSNKAYIGINRYDGEEHAATHKPLISVELFEDVQRQKERQSKEYGSGRSGLHLLAHMCKCGICGSPFNSRIQGPTKQRRLRCEGRRSTSTPCASYCIDAESLENLISGIAVSLADDQALQKHLREKLEAQSKQDEEPLRFERGKLIKEADKLSEAVKEAFNDYYINKIITKEQFETFKAECAKTEKAIRSRIEEIDEVLNGNEIQKVNLDMLWEASASLQDNWRYLTTFEKREALRQVIRGITIYPGKVVVDFGLFIHELTPVKIKRGVAFFVE